MLDEIYHIVQRSGIGPYLFIAYIVGFIPLSSYNNTTQKYAYDTIHLVPQKSPPFLWKNMLRSLQQLIYIYHHQPLGLQQGY